MNWFETLQYEFLRKRYPINLDVATQNPRLPLNQIFGDRFVTQLKDKVVVDFGCGHGDDVAQMGRLGAKLAIGLEIRPELVDANQRRLGSSNVLYTTALSPEHAGKADMLTSIDAFEHFEKPALMLELMHECLRPGGEAWISFGPTWYHPYGGHLFSVFPWAHLILSEKALIKWRSEYFHDGATRFHEVAGGLNRLSIKEFENIVEQSPFACLEMTCHPLRGKRWLQSLIGREFATSMVFARLCKQS